jgi:hypothetical protein
MLITNPNTSSLTGDIHKRQAAELLAHILQYQQLEIHVGRASGDAAANYCADFIEQFAKRTAAMTKP